MQAFDTLAATGIGEYGMPAVLSLRLLQFPKILSIYGRWLHLQSNDMRLRNTSPFAS